jgi:O-antigen ligase
LVLIELRFSPQLDTWVYGYMQHTWLQVVRDGGYRPMVFMEHGLAVALFMATATLCMFGLARTKEKIGGVSALPIAAVMALVVALSHSLGAFAFLLVLGPLIWFMPPRLQLRAAAGMGLLVMLYPMLRAYDWFPTTSVIDMAMGISEDRGWSLAFRFENEDIVLRRAFERPFFGWGGFDRIFIFDKESGDEVSTLDGAWIIIYAQGGLLGFLSKFGLLIWPVYRAFKRVRRVRDRNDKVMLATVGVVAAMVAVDLLPNGLFTYFPFLLSGALLGATRSLSKPQSEASGVRLQPSGQPPPQASRAAAGAVGR